MALSTSALLRLADRLPDIEEDATDYLDDHGIALVSHSRDTIILQALHHGWQPFPRSEALRHQPDPQPPAAA